MVLLIEVKDNNLDSVTSCYELRRMLDLVPREVADVYETLDSLLKLSEYAEVSDIAYSCSV